MSYKVGIIIGLVLVAVVGVLLLVFVYMPTRPHLTVSAAPGYLDLHDVKTPVSTVVGYTPDQEGNAGDDYAKALQIYRDHSNEMESVVKGGQIGLQVRTLLEQMNDLAAAAAHKKSMLYTTVHALKEMQVLYQYNPEPADEFYGLADALKALAYHLRTKSDYQNAENVYFNVVMMGRHMVEERARPVMVDLGMQIQLGTLGALQDMYEKDTKQKDRFDACQKYGEDILRVKEFFDKKTIFRLPSPPVEDVINVAENDQDRAYRVQGVLLLGLVKNDTHLRKRIRDKALALIDQNARGSDAVLAVAARAAQAYTPQAAPAN